MRKQKHPIPPALEHQGRLINPTMRSAKYKRPNALKHGVYATPVLIPGENQKEFEDLLAELLDEYKPRGPSLRHAVHCLADSMWRLRRLKKSVQTELDENTSTLAIPRSMKCGVPLCFFTTYKPNQKPVLIITRKNICAAIKSTIWSRNSRRRITNQPQNGLKLSQLKSFQVYSPQSPNSRRRPNWVSGPTS